MIASKMRWLMTGMAVPVFEIDGLTEKRMLEEHGDLIDERAISEAANEAVHPPAGETAVEAAAAAATGSSLAA